MAEYVSDVLSHSRKRAPIGHSVSLVFVFWTFWDPCNPQTFAPSKAYGANRILDSPNVLKWCNHLHARLLILTEYWLTVRCRKAGILCESVYISDETVYHLPERIRYPRDSRIFLNWRTVRLLWEYAQRDTVTPDLNFTNFPMPILCGLLFALLWFSLWLLAS
jgi:hypothetical protein